MTRTFAIATLVLLVASGFALRAAETNANANPRAASTSRLDFDSFRLIYERNIFNPNRSPGSDGRYTRREPDRRARTESFALVGTMSYEKGRFAFFDGTSSDYRKVSGAGDTIAGYTIGSVTPEHVTLQSTNQQEIKLPVGMQMRRIEEGDWELAARAESSNGSSAASSSTSATSSSGGGDDEVLKRMMQRREQEGGPTSAPEPPPARTENVGRPTNPEPASSGEPDEVLRRLQQKREQELQK